MVVNAMQKNWAAGTAELGLVQLPVYVCCGRRCLPTARHAQPRPSTLGRQPRSFDVHVCIEYYILEHHYRLSLRHGTFTTQTRHTCVFPTDMGR
jgi:hypothetical protein